MSAGTGVKAFPMAAIFSVLLHTAAAGQPAAAVRLIVNDYAGVHPGDVEVALAMATAPYSAAGVTFVWKYECWRRCRGASIPSGGTTLAASDVVVTILGDGMKLPAEFPRAVMGSVPEGSRVAYVMYPRVRAFASKRNLFASMLLGHVIAHEVGHILLREGHSETGLMRAEWERADLELAARGRLGFTAEQGRRLRTHLQGGQESVEPAAGYRRGC